MRTRSPQLFLATVLCCLAAAGCTPDAGPPNVDVLPDLPDHWRNVPGQGIDSNVGAFESGELDLKIHYDIGRLAGAYADADNHPNHQWLKEAKRDGAFYRYLLAADNTLFITFPDEGPANFYAQARDDDEITYVMELVTRYRQDLLEK